MVSSIWRRIWLDAALDVGLLAGAFDDRGVLLVDRDALGAAEVFERDVLELDAEVFGDAVAAGEDGDVFQHGLAAIAEAGSLDGATLSVPRSLFTTSVARASPSTSSAMMRSGLPVLATFSSSGSMSFKLRDLLLVDEDVGILEDRFHRFRVGHEVGREVALVELHAFDDVEAWFRSTWLLRP